MREKPAITVDKTVVIIFYAVNPGGIEYTVTDKYNANVDYTERTILALETQQEPSVAIRNRIAQAIDDFEADS